MASCYSKNGILKGAVDFYCLVCESYLRSEEDSIDHIAQPIHKENLDNTQYVKGFEEDFVRKIKLGYFCEICNKLLPMMARVKIHVREPSHIDGKNVMFFKRIGVNVIAFGKVILNEKAWNGLNDESCAFCNIEYEDEDVHKNLLSHILNIIQIKVEVDENKNIYRKIDDVSFHCLTCNVVLALNDLTHHFDGNQHKLLYKKCCEISLNIVNTNELKETKSNKEIEDQSEKVNGSLAKSLNNVEENTEKVHITRSSDSNTKCDVLEKTTTIDATPLNDKDGNEKQSKIKTNSVGIEKNVDSSENTEDNVVKSVDKTAGNKEESKAVNVDVNIKNKNISEKKVKRNKAKINLSPVKHSTKSGTSNQIAKTTSTKSSFNIEKYEKKICIILKTEDYITLDDNGKTLCILCDWIMDPKAKKIHVSGQHHQTMEKMHKRRLAEIRDKNNNESIVLQKKSILDLVSEFQANDVNINLIFNTAVCKKCSINLPYDVKAIEEHILKHNNEINKHENNVILQSSEAIDKEACENTNEVAIGENSKVEKTVINQKEEKLASVEDTKENEVPISQVPVKIDEELLSETSLKDEFKSKENEEPISQVQVKIDEELLSETSLKDELKSKEYEEPISQVPVKIDEELLSETALKDEFKSKENEEPISQVPVKNDEELLSETSLKDEAKSEVKEVKIDEPSASVHLQKQLLGTYIKMLSGVRYMIFNDIIINDMLCISVFSFNYLISNKDDMKCLICEEEVSDCNAHINKFKHKTLIHKVPVIINEKSEFVREIHPELLHCGFCNITVLSWSKMQEHFNTSSHKETKNAAEWRKLLYSTEIEVQIQNNTSTEVSELSIKNMFSGLL